MPSKYSNKQKTASDGRVFGSIRECNRYEELLLLQCMGRISKLALQVPHLLIETQQVNGFTESAVKYVSNFEYIGEDGKLHVEDTKEFLTKEYIIKRKLMLWLKGIRIEEI
jgi:hypothetical protein